MGLVGLAHCVSHFSQLLLPPLFPWLKDAFQVSYAELGLPADGVLRRLVRGAGALGLRRRPVRAAADPVRRHRAARRSRRSASPPARATRCWSLFAVVAGIGNGVFHPVDYTLLNRKVHTSRLGHAFSVHGITGSLGWALAPAMLVPIALAFSWRVALVSAGVLVLVVLVGAGAQPIAPARSR